MEKQYYYSDGKEKFGPVTISELESLGITANTLVWCEGMKEWQYAFERADLMFLFKKGNKPSVFRKPIFNENEQINYRRPRVLFIIMFALGFSLMVWIYGVMFNSFSETELLNISLLWLIPFLFGLIGLISIGVKSKNPIKISIVITGIILGSLFMMFNALWRYL